MTFVEGMPKSAIADVLTLIVAYDQRTVGDADVEAWYAVAAEASWPSFPVVRRAVVKHHAASVERIKPGHITAILAEARREARGSYTEPPTPTSMRRDADAQRAWLAERYRAHMSAYLEAWADGKPAPRALRAVTA